MLTGWRGWTIGFVYEETPEKSLRDLKELRDWNPVFSFGAGLVVVSLCSPSSPWNTQKREAGHSPAGVRVCSNVHIQVYVYVQMWTHGGQWSALGPVLGTLLIVVRRGRVPSAGSRTWHLC